MYPRIFNLTTILQAHYTFVQDGKFVVACGRECSQPGDPGWCSCSWSLHGCCDVQQASLSPGSPSVQLCVLGVCTLACLLTCLLAFIQAHQHAQPLSCVLQGSLVHSLRLAMGLTWLGQTCTAQSRIGQTSTAVLLLYQSGGPHSW